MLHFNVAQQLRHGSIAAVGVSVDRTSGGPTDFWLRRRGPW